MALTATDLKNIGEIMETSIEAAIEASEARMTAKLEAVDTNLSAKIDESARQVTDDLTVVVRDSQQTIADVMDEKFAEVNGRLGRLERGRRAWS